MSPKKVISIFSALLFSGASAQEVRLYSERHYDADKKVFAQFTEETGIKVNVVKAGANELIERLKSESGAPQADLYITSDIASLTRADESGLLAPLKSETINKQVPAGLRSENDTWTAFTMRSRVIVYAKDRVEKDDLPKTWQDLASPKYRGNVLVRSSTSKYNRSLLSSIIVNEGKPAGFKWASGISKNLARPPQGGDRDQVSRVAKGLADFAITNTYYLGILEKSEDENERAARAAVEVIFPTSGNAGTHVNISGGGIIKGAANAENARKFLEFLVSNSVQSTYQKMTSVYAVVKGIEPEPLQKAWGEITPDMAALPHLGSHDADSVKIFSSVGWK